MINKNDDINLTQLELNEKFIIACYEGHLDVVQYLLTSPDLIRHANIHADNDGGFIWACHNGHLDVVKYLLTSPDLKEHADIHARNDNGFLFAYSEEHQHVVKFLIFDMNIEKPAFIKKYLNNFPNEEIENMFKIREVNEKFNNEITENNTTVKKVKL